MELAALFGSLPAPGSALCRADPGVGMRGRSRTRSRDYLLRSPCAPGSSPCLRSQPGSSTMPESKSSVVARGLMDSLRQSWGGSITEEEVLTDPIEIITDENFDDFVKGSGDRLVVCQFTADWCKPCQKIRPAVWKLAYAHTNVRFGSYECDKAKPEVPKSHGVTAFPAFVLFKSGKKLGLLKGGTCVGELMSIVDSHDTLAS